MDTMTAPTLVQDAYHAARPAPRPAASLHARWARHEEEVQAAQRLRHAVFAGEMGATLRPPPGTPPGLDADAVGLRVGPRGLHRSGVDVDGLDAAGTVHRAVKREHTHPMRHKVGGGEFEVLLAERQLDRRRAGRLEAASRLWAGRR
jgi:hypothetical protein